jgi:hypothetical protein
MSKLILSRRRLFELVWAKPMTGLAQQFGVSARHLAKACDRYDVPRPHPGDWQKLAYGKPLRQTKLADDRYGLNLLIEIDVEDRHANSNSSDHRAA